MATINYQLSLRTSLGPGNYQLATGNWSHIGVALGKFKGDSGVALGSIWETVAQRQNLGNDR